MPNRYKIILLFCLVLTTIGIIAIFRSGGFGYIDREKTNLITKEKSPNTLIDNNIDQKKIDTSETFINNVSPNREFQNNQSIITAKSYLVGDIDTGEIYLSLLSDRVMPVASISKLLAVLATDYIYKTDDLIEIKIATSTLPPELSGIETGEKFLVKELIYPLLLSSSNIVAESLAMSGERNVFTQVMSGYAWEVGMHSSLFVDPSGLDSKNIASARDIFYLAQYLMKYRPDIVDITKIQRYTLATSSDHIGHEFINTHPFAGQSDFIGGKTGRTHEAGETMLSIFNLNNKRIAFVILGSEWGRREADTRLLLEKYLSI